MKRLFITGLLVLSTGCATISNGGSQDFTIKTTNDRDFKSTKCHMENEEGQWMGEPASTVTIHRDGNPMDISCKNELQTGKATVKPVFNVGPMVADIIILCTGCLIIDAATNALYEYPEKVEIPMIDKDSKVKLQQGKKVVPVI